MKFSQKMSLYFFHTIVQKSEKWPKTQIKGVLPYKGALSALFSDFFVDFLRQKNGADPTEAAPDQTNRGAGLVRIRASRSRDSACGNGSKSWRPAIWPSLRRRAQEQLFLIILFCLGTEQFFPRSRLKTMAEIESNISKFNCSGQLAPVSLAPTTAGEAGYMPVCVPDICQCTCACRRSCNIGPPKSLHRSSTQSRIVRSIATMENPTATIIFPHNKMAQKSLNSVTVHL